MKFGRLESVENLDLPLPKDHPLTQKTLGGKPSKSVNIYVGCPVWADRKMLGIVYPKGTKPGDFLNVYSTQFNAIELNATGYGMPSDDELLMWKSSVGKDFVFCPKVPRQISHTNPIAKKSEDVAELIRAVKLFGKNLGPMLLQLSPHFSSDRLTQLLAFCDIWDRKISLHVELRHPSWFADQGTFDDLVKELKKRNIGLAITDVTDRRDVLHQCLTTKSAFVRFDGHDLHPSDCVRLDDWAIRVAQWINAGLERLYFFVHTPQKHLNPYLADHFISSLNKQTGLEIKRPALLKARD